MRVFISISAVLAGVKEVREAVATAQQYAAQGQSTILFVDEVHRFNKAQQDAFLPHVERGTITFIGATTENPSFEVNPALLSRARVYVLKPSKRLILLFFANAGQSLCRFNSMHQHSSSWSRPLTEMPAACLTSSILRLN